MVSESIGGQAREDTLKRESLGGPQEVTIAEGVWLPDSCIGWLIGCMVDDGGGGAF